MNSVRNRILLFFTLFALASCVAVYMGMRSTQSLAGSANNVANNHVTMVFALGQMDVALQKQDNAVYRYALSANKIWLDVCERERSNYNSWFVKAQDSASEVVEQDTFNQIDELYIQYDNSIRQILLSRNRGGQDLVGMLVKSDQFLTDIQGLIDQLQNRRDGMTRVHQERYQRRRATT